MEGITVNDNGEWNGQDNGFDMDTGAMKRFGGWGLPRIRGPSEWCLDHKVTEYSGFISHAKPETLNLSAMVEIRQRN